MQEGSFQPQQFGKYLLTERIGAGGMAEIFRATAFGVEGFTKEICIKRILPTLTSDETFVKMFIDEAKIAVSLHHANVVQVFDLGRIGEHYFIAMELVTGRDLLQVINACRAQKQRMPVPIALRIMSGVCKGLDYAHRVKSEGRPMGIIHRDVSPSNILISWEGDVKVADFGIAKAAHKEQKTATGTMKGKYGYMSPEQVRGEPIDARSDIFAAGILLYECLVGRRLFKGETDLETLEKVREASVPKPPSAINKKVSPEIDDLVLRALALDPADRFQTAGEMHAALADRLFTIPERVDSKYLSDFMKENFAEVIRQEELREAQRRRVREATPPPLSQPPPLPGAASPAAPLTRPDLPTAPPHRRRSALFVGLVGLSVILGLAAAVILAVMFGYQPAQAPRPDAGPARQQTPAPPKKGTLAIDSQPPGAAVFIGDRDSGQKTPARIGDLDRKQVHQVRLALDGYRPWSKQLEFGDMEMVAMQAQLQAEEKKPDPQQPDRPPIRPAFGTLNVNAEGAWAYVWVDGKKQARPTPLYGLKLKAGSHTIELQNPKLKLKASRRVRIRKGKVTDLVVKLK